MEKSMTGDFKIVEEPQKQRTMNPKKFAMWLFIGSVVMLFAAFTSGYIVRRAEGNWVYFDLPVIFYYTTIIVILSSITLHISYLAAKKDRIQLVRVMVFITAVLGILFCAGQYIGCFIDLPEQAIHFVGNPSGSFFIVIAFVHGLHIIGGVVFLLIVLNSALRFKIHSKNLNQLEMCTTYWHFLGGLWLYLFVFLLLYR